MNNYYPSINENEAKVRPIAFYLPQFHPVKENSVWWGEGFTEWTNVARAKPNFEGHYQPHVPKDLGFYDLRIVDVMRQQVDLARSHGIFGFCFYYYWFAGRRILELPLNQFVESDIDFPFCYCWANENWTKTWDGQEKDVLLAQNHSDEDDLAFIHNLIPTFKDSRYIKVDGKPMLLVYRVDLFPNMKKTAAIWRDVARAEGFPDLHLCAVQFYGIDSPDEYGFDAAVEFPPHKFIGPDNKPSNMPAFSNKDFTGGVTDYRKIIAQSTNRLSVNYTWYRGVVPSWDNTARRQNTSHIMLNSSPQLYRFWLQYLVDFTKKYNKPTENFVFINAWNEWAEGAHLEPDLKYGRAYLEETLKAVNHKKIDLAEVVANNDLLSFISKNLNEPQVKLLSDLTSVIDIPGTLSNTGNVEYTSTFKYKFKERLRNSFPGVFNALKKIYRTFR